MAGSVQRVLWEPVMRGREGGRMLPAVQVSSPEEDDEDAPLCLCTCGGASRLLGCFVSAPPHRCG